MTANHVLTGARTHAVATTSRAPVGMTAGATIGRTARGSTATPIAGMATVTTGQSARALAGTGTMTAQPATTAPARMIRAGHDSIVTATIALSGHGLTGGMNQVSAGSATAPTVRRMTVATARVLTGTDVAINPASPTIVGTLTVGAIMTVAVPIVRTGHASTTALNARTALVMHGVVKTATSGAITDLVMSAVLKSVTIDRTMTGGVPTGRTALGSTATPIAGIATATTGRALSAGMQVASAGSRTGMTVVSDLVLIGATMTAEAMTVVTVPALTATDVAINPASPTTVGTPTVGTTMTVAVPTVGAPTVQIAPGLARTALMIAGTRNGRMTALNGPPHPMPKTGSRTSSAASRAIGVRVVLTGRRTMTSKRSAMVYRQSNGLKWIKRPAAAVPVSRA